MKLLRSFRDQKLHIKILCIVITVCSVMFAAEVLSRRIAYRAYDEQLYEKTAQALAAYVSHVETQLEKMDVLTLTMIGDPDTALYVLILLGVWQFGSQMLIFLAAIKDVPMSLHEAAIVDGAGLVKRFFWVTLPMLTPSIFFNLINGIIGSMQAFNSAYLVTAGGPMNSTLYYGLYQYRQAFEYKSMGYASAMAWFLILVIVVLTALIFRSSSSWVYYRSEGR